MLKRLILIALLIIGTASCASECEKRNSKYGCEKCTIMIPVQRPIANHEQTISLQHPTTRIIVHCYTTTTEYAETCAQTYESYNYVRFRDIPYRTAKYDFLKKDTFPTRRWREGERTPRW